MPTTTLSCPATCLAALFHLSENRVRALARLHIIKKLRPGEYDLLASIEGYIAYLRAQLEAQHPRHKPSALREDRIAVILRNLVQRLRQARAESPAC
jgi:DNA-binding response OmpR family regulator